MKIKTFAAFVVIFIVVFGLMILTQPKHSSEDSNSRTTTYAVPFSFDFSVEVAQVQLGYTMQVAKSSDDYFVVADIKITLHSTVSADEYKKLDAKPESIDFQQLVTTFRQEVAKRSKDELADKAVVEEIAKQVMNEADCCLSNSELAEVLTVHQIELEHFITTDMKVPAEK